ncbi:MAG: type II secretion system F family protein [Spongiibacteraceae bacterium]
MEAYHYYFIIGAIILCTAPVLLLAIAHVDSDSKGKQKAEFEFSSKDIWRQLREENTHIASLSQLLRRAGLFNSEQQLNTMVYSIIAAVALALAIALYAFYAGKEIGQILFIAPMSFVGIIFFAYLFLKKIADDRQAQLENETMMLIQTTRMLWRVGLSLPRTLAIICDELRELSANCARELKLAVNKIESGQSQEEALYELINSTSAEGFKEYLIVIRQQSITGGSIDKSLDELYQLLQNRRRLGLQEEVTKMSGKMSLVMMVFLFPALLIFAAGPSLLAMTKSMANL